jgi:hypothetical protein
MPGRYGQKYDKALYCPSIFNVRLPKKHMLKSVVKYKAELSLPAINFEAVASR